MKLKDLVEVAGLNTEIKVVSEHCWAPQPVESAIVQHGILYLTIPSLRKPGGGHGSLRENQGGDDPHMMAREE